jgi:hypothetical protein
MHIKQSETVRFCGFAVVDATTHNENTDVADTTTNIPLDSNLTFSLKTEASANGKTATSSESSQ